MNESQRSLSGVRILVVEGHTDEAEMYQIVLSLYGAEVRVVDSAEVGLEVLKAWRPDALVGEIGVSEYDRYALIRAVRTMDASETSHVKAVAISGRTRPIDRAQALEAGYDAFVPKPVDVEGLVDELSRLVDFAGNAARSW